MPYPTPDTRLHFPLPDGTPVLFRPITPADRQRLAEGIEQLSLRSRLSRFFSPRPHFTEAQLSYLTEVDQDHHVAWVAETDEEKPVGIAVARFARLPNDPGAAEAAVTVLDAYQSRGVGTIMMGLLYLSAQRLGLARFRAYVLLQNEALVHSLQAFGGIMGDHAEGAVEISLPVLPTEALPDRPAVRPFQELLRRLAEALPPAGASG